MPRGDGTGPRGDGPRTGAGRGGGSGLGGGGFCVCVKCGEKIPHQAGVPCYEKQCPTCGSAMTRDSDPGR